eukprot:TRINITY_DN136567_c0_g1_i1.p1 TRINITY_DN136567_c0_g1~~TRINITY_DN136567_c0_g1_i1.p1  ORF type:complete len:109 (-),score=11.15 TRINITY_DN136567_c0_g1_i1:28-354(-)
MASNDLGLKLSIRGAAAASKTSQLQVLLNITNNSGRTINGNLQMSLKDVISNEFVKPKTESSISVPASGFSQQFNLGEFFDTPKTGAYLVTATLNGSSSNQLSVKILL